MFASTSRRVRYRRAPACRIAASRRPYLDIEPVTVGEEVSDPLSFFLTIDYEQSGLLRIHRRCPVTLACAFLSYNLAPHSAFRFCRPASFRGGLPALLWANLRTHAR